MQDTTQTVVISDAFWKRKFNGDPGVLGKISMLTAFFHGGGGHACGLRSFLRRRDRLVDPGGPCEPRYSERAEHWLMPIAR